MGFQVHIADGIQFVREVAADGSSGKHGNNDAQCDAECPSSNGNCSASHAESKVISKFDTLIIDVDSSDSRYMCLLNVFVTVYLLVNSQAPVANSFILF